jgi:sortase A
MRRALRITGLIMIVTGLGLLGWAALVWRWQDPFTALYTRYEQHKLADAYKKRAAQFRPRVDNRSSLAVERRAIAREATRYRRASRRGDALGRMIVPRLHLKIILVNGTDHDTLKRGPGRDLRTFMPGENELVYVAGHRTTYLAPFAHIDALRSGDRVTVELPYATFVYRVTSHRVVTADDIAVLRSHHRELLILQACHPRFFASHRYLAYARPVRVLPVGGGAPYSPAAAEAAAAR